VFTNDLFVNGLNTLTNTIHMYLSDGVSYLKKLLQPLVVASTVFELILSGNELWVKAIFENQSSEKFCVQVFNEMADLNGSRLHQFVKGVFQAATPGEKKAKLVDKWESAAKHINRIKLPKSLKSKVFSSSRDTYYQLQGLRVVLTNKDKISLILKGLRKGHSLYVEPYRFA
jgi:hypothetical protein